MGRRRVAPRSPNPIDPLPNTHARLFVSFDQEHDADLYERLVAEAAEAGSGFEIAARSGELSVDDPWEERQRRCVREADLLVVLCGEHTHESRRVDAELRMAQEEGTPYFLLWGRREGMCKLPGAARKGDGMYSWTADILRDRIYVTLRDARDAEIEAAKAEAAAAAKAERR
ncbi:MAG: TIR domain-containing protein [Myxococcota bacterium]|nr:TIR domain-containing protein [Myxococcota bacterium]